MAAIAREDIHKFQSEIPRPQNNSPRYPKLHTPAEYAVNEGTPDNAGSSVNDGVQHVVNVVVFLCRELERLLIDLHDLYDFFVLAYEFVQCVHDIHALADNVAVVRLLVDSVADFKVHENGSLG